jgi:hypothetical protein
MCLGQWSAWLGQIQHQCGDQTLDESLLWRNTPVNIKKALAADF